MAGRSIFFKRSTDVSCQTEILSDFASIVHHDITILLLVVAIRVGIGAIRLSISRDRRSIALVFTFAVRIIETSTSSDILFLSDIILHQTRQHIAVLHLRTEVTVSDPVRILNIHTEVTRGPRLHAVATCLIIALEDLFLLEVAVTWVKVETYDRVEVGTIRDHVIGIVTDVASRYIEGQLIVEELRRVTDRSIVTVISVVGDNTLRVEGRSREVSLILIRTRREAEGIIKGRPSLEEVPYIERRRRSKLVTP